MGNQHVNPDKRIESDRQSSNSSPQQTESTFTKLQEVLGNEAGGDRFKSKLHHYQQTGSKNASHPLDALLASIGEVKPSRNKPLFRGLSNELQGNPASSGMVIQARMAVRPAGDRYEQEADRVADQVVQRLNMVEEERSQPEPALQQEPQSDNKEILRMKTLESSGEAIQRGAVPTELESAIAASRGQGQSLDPSLQQSMEQALGVDFSEVKVHTDVQADHFNHSIQSKAFTTGQDIFFRMGEYQPNSQNGQKLIAHELTHVIQQNGLTQHNEPTTQSKEIIQRDVLPGQKKPRIEDLTKERFRQLLQTQDTLKQQGIGSRILNDAKQFIQDKSFMMNVFLEASAENPALAGEKKDLDIVENILLNVMVNAQSIVAAKSRAVDELSEIEALLGDNSHHNFRTHLLTKFFKKSKEYTEQQAPDRLSQEFLANRQVIGLAQGHLNNQDRDNFATALKNMPTVKYLLETKVVPLNNVRLSNWKDGGLLKDKIQYVQKTGIFGIRQNQVNQNQIEGRVQIADQFIRGIVEPHLLVTLPRPTIKIHLEKAQDYSAPLGFRAFQNNDEVNIAYNDPVSVIAHEIGHYLEDYLPSEIWHDIQLLLRKRHEESGGGRIGLGQFPIPNEGRYKGNYQATGPYTSKVYDDRGSTEVMSMTLEFLSDSARALKMIEKDPLQAAIILRSLRPQEYASAGQLRAFDQFLPR